MAFKALVVDLDGTIWDSRPWYAELIADTSGLNSSDLLRQLETIPLPTLIDQAPGITRAGFASEMRIRVDGLTLYPGVRGTLQVLAADGVQIGVATSLPGWIARPLLDETGLTPLFRGIADASSGRKPAPHLVELALPGIDIERATTYVVGDDPKDAELSRRAEVNYAWAAYGYGTAPDLPEYVSLGSFGELLDI